MTTKTACPGEFVTPVGQMSECVHCGVRFENHPKKEL